ncbi:MAG: putative xylanase/chitin deacetilase [Patescibacteria group bacterium]|nr:putative xylanase/chitin deacetilase [Patescibacteria group bacterium]
MKSNSKIIFVIVLFVVLIGGGIYAGVSHAQKAKSAVSQDTYHPGLSATPPTLGVDTAPVASQNPSITYTGPDAAHQNVTILVYHSFGPMMLKKESKLQSHYRITSEDFDKQMKYLSDNNYHPVTFAELVTSFRNNTPLPEKAVVLSFDDGWKSQYQYALPILEKYKFKGTFFIITNYQGYGAYMTWDDVIALDRAGMDIESHTVHHVNLAKAKTPAQVASELADSKATLEAKLGHPVIALAYPEYGHNPTVDLAVKNAGYLGARAGWAKFSNSIDHIFELKSQEPVNNPNPFLDKRLPDGQ